MEIVVSLAESWTKHSSVLANSGQSAQSELLYCTVLTVILLSSSLCCSFGL